MRPLTASTRANLFDIKLLYENEGLADLLFRTFRIYVASSPRPPHELLRPTRAPPEEQYLKEFEDMTRRAVTLEELAEARERLIADIAGRLDKQVQRFLLSLHDAEPDFAAIAMPQAAALPAVRWKVQNLARQALYRQRFAESATLRPGRNAFRHL